MSLNMESPINSPLHVPLIPIICINNNNYAYEEEPHVKSINVLYINMSGPSSAKIHSRHGGARAYFR